MKDYYKILNIHREATDQEIRKAYKKLSMKHHPDRPNGNEEKFKEVNEAYEVLIDPIKRMQYNQGQTPTGNNPENGDFYEESTPNFRFRTNVPGAGRNMPNGFNFSQFTSGNPFGSRFFRGGTSFENIFGNNEDEFDPTSFLKKQPHIQEKELQLSFEEMYKGGQQKISYPKQVIVDGESVTIIDTLDLNIPAKCHIGKKFKLTIPTDKNQSQVIMISVIPKKHKFYRLKEPQHKQEPCDLEITMPISLRDSLVGFRMRIPGIDGEEIVIEEDQIIDPRSPYKLDGKGFVDKSGHRGDLYINFDVKYPKKLSIKQRNEIKKIL